MPQGTEQQDGYSHDINASMQTTPEKAKVDVNLRTVPAAEVKHELGTIFATKQSIRVCGSNPTPQFSGSCQINSPAPENIIAGDDTGDVEPAHRLRGQRDGRVRRRWQDVLHTDGTTWSKLDVKLATA